jgi:hypothetical protein
MNFPENRTPQYVGMNKNMLHACELPLTAISLIDQEKAEALC